MPQEDLITKYKGEVLAVQNLPTLPSALQEMNRMLDDPNVSTEQIAELISKDQVLSAKVLKMVNSPIYGFPGRISSVQHALVLLGFNVVRGLLLSTTVFDNLNAEMRKLWDHSMACSMACAEIARTLKFKDPGEFAVSGLLHDIGKVVIEVQVPEAAREIRKLVKEKDLDIRQAEEEVLGFMHDKVNGWLAGTWRLPLTLREGITYHHNPTGARNYTEIACVVHIGDFIARIFHQGSGGDDQAPTIMPQAFKILGLTQDKLEEILDETTEKFSEISGFAF